MIILASASPRRQELLKLITENFIVIPSDIDEGVPNNIETEKRIPCCEKGKAYI